MGLELKNNVIFYAGNSTAFTKEKNRIFEDNIFLFNTTTKALYIADGKTKLSALNEVNSASDLSDYVKQSELDGYVETAELEDYAKTSDLEGYAKIENVRPILDFDEEDETISVPGALYMGDAGFYLGDGETAVMLLPVFVAAADNGNGGGEV